MFKKHNLTLSVEKTLKCKCTSMIYEHDVENNPLPICCGNITHEFRNISLGNIPFPHVIILSRSLAGHDKAFSNIPTYPSLPLPSPLPRLFHSSARPPLFEHYSRIINENVETAKAAAALDFES